MQERKAKKLCKNSKRDFHFNSFFLFSHNVKSNGTRNLKILPNINLFIQTLRKFQKALLG